MSDPMDLHTALPPQLIQSLTDPGTSIQVTAAAFLSQEAVAGNEFPRGCQLKNTIDQIGNQQPYQHQPVASLGKGQSFGVADGGRCTDDPVSDIASGINVGIMEFKVQYSDGQYSLKINEDQLHALLLNAEFVLVQMYSEYGLQWNPFLIRWIELYQHLLGKYLESDYRGGGSANYEMKSNGQSEGGVNVLKLRTAFIGAILNEVEQVSLTAVHSFLRIQIMYLLMHEFSYLVCTLRSPTILPETMQKIWSIIPSMSPNLTMS